MVLVGMVPNSRNPTLEWSANLCRIQKLESILDIAQSQTAQARPPDSQLCLQYRGPLPEARRIGNRTLQPLDKAVSKGAPLDKLPRYQVSRVSTNQSLDSLMHLSVSERVLQFECNKCAALKLPVAEAP